jgi:acyl-CoA synthetase (NDP forming)
VNSYLNWKAPGQRPDAAEDVAVASRIAARLADRRLSEREAGELFSALGIMVVEHRVLQARSDMAGSTAEIDLPGPFAVKIVSPDIAHKTDAGMVILNVPREELGVCARSLCEAAKQRFASARIDGVLVQQMERGLAELIVGFRRDPEIGPVVLLGMGGIAAELRKVVAIRVAPTTLETAHEMVAELRELELLRGFRNLPRGDINALVTTICSMSQLAHLTSRTVLEAEINPLIVKEHGSGAVAVDCLVVFA